MSFAFYPYLFIPTAALSLVAVAIYQLDKSLLGMLQHADLQTFVHKMLLSFVLPQTHAKPTKARTAVEEFVLKLLEDLGFWMITNSRDKNALHCLVLKHQEKYEQISPIHMPQ